MGCTVNEGVIGVSTLPENVWDVPLIKELLGVHFTGKYLGCTVDEGVIGASTLPENAWDVPLMKELLGCPIYRKILGMYR